MSYEDQRRRYQQQRAERQVIDQAAAQLRHRAILAAYEGAERKEVAFGLASVLAELARDYRGVDEQLRALTLDCCRRLLRTEGRPGDPAVTSLPVTRTDGPGS